jgi:hypothetical protein
MTEHTPPVPTRQALSDFARGVRELTFSIPWDSRTPIDATWFHDVIEDLLDQTLGPYWAAADSAVPTGEDDAR